MEERYVDCCGELRRVEAVGESDSDGHSDCGGYVLVSVDHKFVWLSQGISRGHNSGPTFVCRICFGTAKGGIGVQDTDGILMQVER